MTGKHAVMANLDLEPLDDRPSLLPAIVWVRGTHLVNCTFMHGCQAMKALLMAWACADRYRESYVGPSMGLAGWLHQARVWQASHLASLMMLLGHAEVLRHLPAGNMWSSSSSAQSARSTSGRWQLRRQHQQSPPSAMLCSGHGGLTTL